LSISQNLAQLCFICPPRSFVVQIASEAYRDADQGASMNAEEPLGSETKHADDEVLMISSAANESEVEGGLASLEPTSDLKIVADPNVIGSTAIPPSPAAPRSSRPPSAKVSGDSPDLGRLPGKPNFTPDLSQFNSKRKCQGAVPGRTSAGYLGLTSRAPRRGSTGAGLSSRRQWTSSSPLR
jgi:hypothetical protein